MKSNLLRVVACLLLSLNSLLAQTPSDEGISFRTYGWSVSVDDLYYMVKDRDTKVIITDSSRSAFFKAEKVKQLVFYRLITGPNGKPAREVAATVNISAAGPWPLLIFMPDPKEPKRYRVAAIADDLKTFPFPTCEFVNFTEHALYAKYGDQQVHVAAGGIGRIDPQLKAGKEDETRFTTISMNTPEGRRVLYSNNWVACAKQRTLVFISFENERIQVSRLRDSIAIYTPPKK